ncbi:polysaccharide lyase family 7 protein [Microvirga solisilvae]|uniref:polysaccharide lyase family 7 protein n=1 Tax=Microvirga solisilvae TaxID=2919498 RepID=UPI0024344768|nr:polysaccharide lyase family 7 protein [Microvirga solisilvae]
MVLNPAYVPSRNFNLANWKITLPIDRYGHFSGTAVEVKNLSGYRNSKYFYTGSDGAMVFTAPVEGATTSGSRFARSELREMKGTERAAWTLKQGGSMTATLEVDKVPTLFNGKGGKIVIGQIHGQSDELVRLYWENNTVYFKNEKAGPRNAELRFDLKNALGQMPNISRNEKFTYKISAKGDDLKVAIYADGKVYTSQTHINRTWNKDTFYFKAGAYLGVNETQGRGIGQTSFYSLSFSHSASSAASVSSVFKGNKAGNTLTGKAGNDALYGYEGNDRLIGREGNDILLGGLGRDTFVFNTKLSTKSNLDLIADFNPKDDTILLDNAVFSKIARGVLQSSKFVIGSKAKDASDRIIYNNKTGALLYDPDGSGPSAAMQFAKVKPNLSITASDFLIL